MVKTASPPAPTEFDWVVKRIRGKRAEVVGHVVAKDSAEATARAVAAFHIKEADRMRLIVMRVNL